MRRRLTIFLTFLGGLYFFLEFIIPATIPGGVPKLPQYGKILGENGTHETDGSFSFATGHDAVQAMAKLGVDRLVALHEQHRAGSINLRPFRKGRMLAVNGLVVSVPVTDPEAVPDNDWSHAPSQWERTCRWSVGPQRFAQVAARHGGSQVAQLRDIDTTFEFASMAAAAAACAEMGLDIVPPVGTNERQASLELGKRGTVVVRVAHQPSDVPEEFFRYRKVPARLVRVIETHRYFAFNAYQDEITVGFICVSALAIGLGLINVLRSHGINMVFRRRRWGYSAVMVISMFATMVVIGWDWRNSVSRERARKFAAQTVAERHAVALAQWERDGRTGDMPRSEEFSLTPEEQQQQTAMIPGRISSDISHIYQRVIIGIGGLFVSLGSAMFSLLAVYIAAAAYRAFRLKSGEAALMMIFAVMVMIGQTPIAGEIVDPMLRMVGIGDGVTAIRSWVLVHVNTPAFRAIELGSAIAGLAMGFRVWLSMERGSFYGD